MVLAAAVTKLLELQTARGRLLVLRRCVIPFLALSALQCHNLSHLNSFQCSVVSEQWPVLAVHTAHCSLSTTHCPLFLLRNLSNRTRAHRASAFANRKPQALFQCHRRNQLNRQFHVVARHHHLHTRRQLRNTR